MAGHTRPWQAVLVNGGYIRRVKPITRVWGGDLVGKRVARQMIVTRARKSLAREAPVRPRTTFTGMDGGCMC